MLGSFFTWHAVKLLAILPRTATWSFEIIMADDQQPPEQDEAALMSLTKGDIPARDVPILASVLVSVTRSCRYHQ